MEKAIQKAISEGGYFSKHKNVEFTVLGVEHEDTMRKAFYGLYLLDPLFWQALGKAEGWNDKLLRTYSFEENERTAKSTSGYIPTWQYHWHRFIDHIAEGKDIDSFFDALLK